MVHCARLMLTNSLNNLYVLLFMPRLNYNPTRNMYILKENETVSLKQKAAIMQDLCTCVSAEQGEMKDLVDCNLQYHRVCGNCNALHAPEYRTYGDLFCSKCGNRLCMLDAENLDLYMARRH
ncbi:unknown [Choristoneura fumiferana multiple nucleopolyhedrovirus]|uniref:Uncharacterized protein n=1 Tax=Choristoneura fumiferana nuclear polyhedrosis virus TaxID=208973 RepID=Q7TLP6_NPVCF|nr:unknown [Choristoneura fumiferana multiple nucleopolyhedrovirus]AAP29885.1 unknown [Choristoneura fumiferana multiple nucleopolyhedrovirus]